MKITKIISAAAVSVVMAASMVMSASAATTAEVAAAAKANGVQDHNVQQLSNFLEANEKAFTDAQRDDMIATLNETGKIVDGYVAEGKDKATLTEEERTALFKSMKEEDRQAIIKALTDLGDKVNVEVTTAKRGDGNGYDVSAKLKVPGDDSKTSSDGANSSKGGKSTTTPINNDGKAPATGNSVDGSAAALIAGISIALAGAGIVVVSKKNKEN